MMQTKLSTKIEAIGEEIGLELGTQMVKSYQQANPSDVHSYLIGRNIIEQILAQPGCVGIQFYNAYNEIGEKTLVYVGIGENGKTIIELTAVNEYGLLDSRAGIVADRVRTEGGRPTIRPSISEQEEDWGWTTD
jgi:hypothetical protein